MAARATVIGWLGVWSLAATGCGPKKDPGGQVGTPVTGADVVAAASADAQTSAPPTVAMPGDAAPATQATSAADAAVIADATPSSDAAVATDAAVASDGAVASDAKTAIVLDAPGLQKLAEGVADCKLSGWVIDESCKGEVLFRETIERVDPKVLDALGDEVGLALLGHASPAVRVKAIHLLEEGIGTSDKGRPALVAAFPKEKDPGVRSAILRVVGNDAARHKEVGELVLAAFDDKDLDVRAQALYALSSRWNKSFEAGIKRLEKAARSDKDAKMRRAACEHAGELGADSLIGMYTDLTDAKVDEKLQASCMRGLVAMWADAPAYENASEKAYRLTLTLLERAPRTKLMPPRAVVQQIGEIGVVSAKTVEKSHKKEGWKNRVRKWYDPRRVRIILASLVTDEATDEATAAEAVLSYGALGASKGELELLKKRLFGKDRVRDMSPVELAFDKAILAAQKRDAGGDAAGGDDGKKAPKPDIRDIQKRPPLRRPIGGPVPPKITPHKAP